MMAIIYCRVYPNNLRVSKPDKLKAQERRCRAMLRQMGVESIWSYKEEGSVHPIHFTEHINDFLERLRTADTRPKYVVTDHPIRFGNEPKTQDAIRTAIRKRGGFLLHTNWREVEK